MTRLVAGRYRILEPLGGGGTAIVSRAADEDRGGEVAIKELRPQFAADALLRRRFLREAELSRPLRHEGIVRLLDAGEHAGIPFMVLELVRGPTLRQELDRQGPLAIEPARSTFIWLARALDHAHGRGVIHRDVKPENVFVTPDGVKLGDFGNARVVSLASVTGASSTWGTPEYVAPEVFVRGRADPRSDLYSLGAVFYEMLTGRLPWSRSETLTRLGGRAGGTPAFAPTGYGEHVDRLIGDLLAFSPARRPASGEEAIVRLTRPEDAAIVSETSCSACAAPRPDDLPRCLSCGEPALRLAHDATENWRLVLRSLEDDATALERLLRLLDSLAQPLGRPLVFLTGEPAMYSEEETKWGIALPAVLFGELDEATARELEALFRRQELDVIAVHGVANEWLAASSPRKSLLHALPFGLVIGAGLTKWTGSVLAGIAIVAGGLGVMQAFWVARGRLRMRRAAGLLTLREQIASTPAADALLVTAGEAADGVRASDVRALLGDMGVELYRLTRRAEQLGAMGPEAAQETAPMRRIVDVASELLARLRRTAARLDDLDQALAGASEGELMQMLMRLERAAAAADADGAALAATRRDHEAALERRHAAEEERARLSAKLCQLLGRLRLLYRQALVTETAGEEEARMLQAATAEVEAMLASPPDRVASG